MRQAREFGTEAFGLTHGGGVAAGEIDTIEAPADAEVSAVVSQIAMYAVVVDRNAKLMA